MLLNSAIARGWLVALASASIAAYGCAGLPRIDPTGEQILSWEPQPAAYPAPGVSLPAVVAPGLTLTPARIVAPVGAEVLMVAGVHGAGQPDLAGQRVEWMLSPGSVGNFLAVGESEQPRLFRFGAAPQKVTNDYVVSETQGTARIITRGTVDPSDDVSVLPGQAWVTLASPIEGSSHITAFAPDIQGAIGNRQSAVVHWVDIRWLAPPSATVAAGGKHTLVTSVTRASSGAPLAGYKVRYEFAGGVDAGFGPALSGGVELTTNDQGLASAELSARDASPGSTNIQVQLVRPTSAVPGVSEPLTLGSVTVAVTWAAAVQPQLPGPAVDGSIAPAPAPAPRTGETTPAPGTTAGGLEVKITSPTAPIAVGGQAEFQIHISNTTRAAINNVTVLDRFGAGLAHAVAPSPIRRNIGTLAPGESRSIGLTFTARQPGRQCHSVEVTSDTGLRAAGEGCVTVIADEAEAAANLSIKQTGPARMKVGEIAVFKIEVANRGATPLNGLRVSDSWQSGLEPLKATDGNQRIGENEIGWNYNKPLEPGGTALFEVQFRAVSR